MPFLERSPAPLWEIFRDGKQLDVVVLNIRVLAIYGNVTHEPAFGDEQNALAEARKYDFRGLEIPLHQPERLLSTPLVALPVIERPRAMVTKLLQTCADSGKVRLLCLGEAGHEMLRFRHLVHFWITLPTAPAATTMGSGGKVIRSAWMAASIGIRPALMKQASKKEKKTGPCLRARLLSCRTEGQRCGLSQSG